ncbi:hypothetical protein [Pseudoalteromonas sp. 31A1]|uniref:hypothetical protein n=1 Tax=Pseudoalteromonas sp. 31A1 TaxID=2686351 RepID=UPI0013FDE1B8|nr:hypothetical protein [Pseudoalteromonas sp. 31A1]
MESIQQRFERLQNAMNAIVSHDPEHSFTELIDDKRALFKGFKMIYSTNHLDGNFAKSSLKSIEDECPVLKKYFYGNGLLFFSDELYDKTWIHGEIKIPLDYSLSLDSNAAERFRAWEDGKDLDKSIHDFEKLVRFIKDGEGNGFNFDYSFFLIENYFDSMKENNHRPFNTIRALKRFDHLNYDMNNFDVTKPIFYEDRAVAGQRAIETLHAFHSSPEILKFQERRMLLYIVLLKAVILRQNIKTTLAEKISELVLFCLNDLGKFPKTELYFAWKLLKYGKQLRFFDPVSQISKKTLKKIKGMSWDIFALRYQETLASKGDFGEFFIPFFASFDNRFVELAQACPIRAVLLDEKGKNVITIQLDELEFQTELNTSIEPEVHKMLLDTELKLKRMNTNLSNDTLVELALSLEFELEAYC